MAAGIRFLSGVVEIVGAERQSLSPLFTDPRPLSPGIDMVLENLGGAAFADDATTPRATLLTLAGYAYFGGDASSDGASVLIGLLDDRWRLIIGDQQWLERVQSQVSGTTSINRMTFSREALDIDVLRQRSGVLPDATEIVAVDADIASRMHLEIENSGFLGVFQTPEAFMAGAMGFVALRGGKVVCGATAATMSANAVEIQITTSEAAQRQGLATAVSAALIVHCLENGLEPHWSTTNEPSRGLAEKLGYVKDATHQTLVRAS